MASAVPFRWVLPEELRSPAPRPVSRRAGTGTVIFLRLFILPHTLIGFGALFLVVFEPLFLILTPDTLATVIALTPHTSRKGGTTYRVTYRYSPVDAPGVSLTGDDQISWAEFVGLRSDSQIYVHTAGVGCHRYTCLSRTFGGYVRYRYPMWFWALFWNGIVSIFLYTAWVVPTHNRNLVRFGDPVAGQITGKNIMRGKSTTYRLKYEFTPIGDHHARKGSTTVATKPQFDQATEGQNVTILYDPNRPGRNVAYEFGDYVVVIR
jgi:hypothetical protein